MPRKKSPTQLRLWNLLLEREVIRPKPAPPSDWRSRQRREIVQPHGHKCPLCFTWEPCDEPVIEMREHDLGSWENYGCMARGLRISQCPACHAAERRRLAADRLEHLKQDDAVALLRPGATDAVSENTTQQNSSDISNDIAEP